MKGRDGVEKEDAERRQKEGGQNEGRGDAYRPSKATSRRGSGCTPTGTASTEPDARIRVSGLGFGVSGMN